MRRAHWAAPTAAAALLGLYWAWPDKVFVFDGVMFGYIIERRVADLGAVLFNCRHLLFNPLMMGLRDALAAAGVALGGYEFIQRVNAVAGAASALVFARVVRRLTGDEALSAAAALLLGVTAVVWSRATEGQVYMLMTLGSLVALWGGAFVVLDAFWPGGIFFWTLPAAAFVAAAAALGAWSLRAGVLPQSRVENNAGWRSARFVKEHTLSTSWVAISGLGFPNSKVYLSQFAQRTTHVLEYDLRGGPKAQALGSFRAFLAQAARYGVPVYALNDLVDDAAARANVESIWGVTPGELDALFAGGRLEPVADDGRGLRVYLYVPRDARAELFAGLAFNILDIADEPRREESLRLFERVAAGTPLPEKRRAVDIMRRTNFGAQLAFEGMKPFLDARLLLAAKEYADHFAPPTSPRVLAALDRISRALDFRPRHGPQTW